MTFPIPFPSEKVVGRSPHRTAQSEWDEDGTRRRSGVRAIRRVFIIERRSRIPVQRGKARAEQERAGYYSNGFGGGLETLVQERPDGLGGLDGRAGTGTPSRGHGESAESYCSTGQGAASCYCINRLHLKVFFRLKRHQLTVLIPARATIQ